MALYRAIRQAIGLPGWLYASQDAIGIQRPQRGRPTASFRRRDALDGPVGHLRWASPPAGWEAPAVGRDTRKGCPEDMSSLEDMSGEPLAR